jgi:hypothetical protein
MLSHLFHIYDITDIWSATMGEREKIAERLRKKEQEIQELEEKIKESRVYIQALQDVLKIFPRESVDSETALRAGSMVAQAREAILKAGRPMHVNEIVTALGRERNRASQTAVSASIAAYVRKGEIFTRPLPNTFSLKELESVRETSLATDEPPADFGQDPATEESSGSKRLKPEISDQQAEDFDDDIPF